MKRILIADDDHKIRALVKRILKNEDYNITEAKDGEEAYTMTQLFAYDLIVTDGLMPKLHGFDLCNRLKQERYPTKIIIMTAVYKSSRYRTDVKADGYLLKPFEPEQLVSLVKKLLTTDEKAS